MTRDISNDDLVKVKRMGQGKVKAVRELINDTPNPKALTAGDFASIPGVSEGMGAELVKLIQDPDAYTPQAPTPRKRAKAVTADAPAPTKKATRKRTAKKATAKKATARTASSNGNGKVKAKDVRLFARDADRLGLTDVAADLRNRVSSLNDDETVSKSELARS
jgi:hypothetical protein